MRTPATLQNASESSHYARLSEPTHSSSHRAVKPESVSFWRSPRILLVEDDPTVRYSLNAVLVSEGYLVIPAANGQKALELAAKFPVDLVLLDLNMPVKNGWDTFEPLTAAHPLIPVIITTARPNQRFTALAAGAAALLEKPLDILVLLQTMEKVLAESAEQRLARLVGKKSGFHYHPGTEARR